MKKLKRPLEIPVLEHPDEVFDATELTMEERMVLQYQISLQAWELRGLPISADPENRKIVLMGQMKELKGW